MNDNGMIELSQRSQRLIDSLSEAIMSAAEAAAEKIQLASEVAKIQQRMAAFDAVIQCIDLQRQPLLARLESCKAPAQRALIERQIALLTDQEALILERAGAPKAAAYEAIEHVAADPNAVRVGPHTRRRPAIRNGAPITNGVHEG